MKISINKTDLIKGVTTAQKAVTRSDQTIFSCILIIANDDNNMHLLGNNQQISIDTKINCTVSQAGETAINARLFGDIIRKLPEDDINLDAKNGKLKIVSGKAKFELQCVDGSSYPRDPEIKEKSRISITQKTLRKMIACTQHSIAEDPKRIIFTGAFLEVKEYGVNMVCIDGHRMAVKSDKTGNPQCGSVIIPGKTIRDIYSLLADNNDPVDIILSDKKAVISIGDTKATTALIHGEYMTYDKLIPDKFQTRIKVDKVSIYNTIDRITVMLHDNVQWPCIFDLVSDELTISANTPVGAASDTIIIDTDDNQQLRIGFNPRYWLDMLKTISDEIIEISFESGIGPCVIKGADYTHMLLPVRIGTDND